VPGRAKRTELPRRERRYRFVLTPLADAMFQLLIFFMLSSSLTPYSLLTIRSAPENATIDEGGAGGGDAPPPAGPTIGDASTALWTIEEGAIVIAGTSFDFEVLPDLAAALGEADDAADVILIVRDSARMQDITSVLEALQAANIGSVQITSGAI